MKSNKKTFSFEILLLWLSLIATAILRSVALSRDLNFEFGYFEDKTLISVAGWLIFGICILFFAGTLWLKKNEPLIPTYSTPATYIPSALVAAALLFLSKNLFSQFASYVKAGPMHVGAVLALLCALCAIGCAVGFFFYVMLDDRKSDIRSYFLMLISVFLVFYSIYLYFDSSLPINAPNKITDQMAYVAAAVFFLFEARASMGQNSWKGYAAIGYPAALLAAYSSIPSISAFFIKGEIVSNSIYETVLTFTIFLFISARLILITEYELDCESDAVKIIRTVKSNSENPESTIDTEAVENEELVVESSEESENADGEITSQGASEQ